jgi:hypothetical protein
METMVGLELEEEEVQGVKVATEEQVELRPASLDQLPRTVYRALLGVQEAKEETGGAAWW